MLRTGRVSPVPPRDGPPTTETSPKPTRSNASPSSGSGGSADSSVASKNSSSTALDFTSSATDQNLSSRLDFGGSSVEQRPPTDLEKAYENFPGYVAPSDRHATFSTFSEVTGSANPLAREFDNSITEPSRRDPQIIRDSMQQVINNTEADWDDDQNMFVLETGIKRTISGNSLDSDYNARKDELIQELAIEDSYRPAGADTSSRMSVQNSFRDGYGQQIPYASDAYNAHTNIVSAEYPSPEIGTAPRLPDSIQRHYIVNEAAGALINGIFDNYPPERRNDDGSLSLGMNRDHTDSRRMQETQDLLNIINNTVNGKSTMNWIRDFNTMHNTEHSIERVTIERSPNDHVNGLPLTNLNFDIR